MQWNSDNKPDYFGSIFEFHYDPKLNSYLVKEILDSMTDILCPIDKNRMQLEFNKRDIYLHKRVKVIQNGEQILGKNLGLTLDGEISIHDQQGKIRKINNGSLFPL